MKQTVQVDTKTFIRFWGVIIGLGLLGLFIWQAWTGILLVVAAIFLAVALNPFVGKVMKVIPGKNRKVANALAFVIVLAVLAAILAIIVPVIVSQTLIFVENLPATFENVSHSLGWLNELGDRIGVIDLRDQVLASIGNFSAEFARDFGVTIINSAGALMGVIAAVILLVVLTFLFSLEGPSILNHLKERFSTNKRTPKVLIIVERMADTISKYVSGQLIVALVDGLVTAGVIFVLALVFGFSPAMAVPFGLITAIACLIPVFGSMIGSVLVTLLLAFTSWPAAIVHMAVAIVYMQVEANFVSPKIQGKRQGMSPLLVLAAVTIGVYSFGILGALIAVPVVGCIKILIEELYNKDKEKKVEA